MQLLGFVVGLFSLALEVTLLWRARQGRLLIYFPFFYSYLLYMFCWSLVVFVTYWAQPSSYASVYWFYFVLSIVAEFAVLIEVSDHIFRPFPAIRNLGRAITILLSVTLGLTYILPTILHSHGRWMALLDFALRASLTKTVILGALLLAAHRYGLRLGKNVAGLMLGFSIYLGVNVANFALDESFGHLYDNVLWVMSPIAFTLCLLVWTVTLWELVPVPKSASLGSTAEENSDALAYELSRFNDRLSHLLRR